MEHKTVINSYGTLMEQRSFTWNIANFMEIKDSNEQINAQQTHFKIGSTIGLPLNLRCALNLNNEDSSVRSAGVNLNLDLIQVKKNENIKDCAVIQVEMSTPFRVCDLLFASAKHFIGQCMNHGDILPLDLSEPSYSSKLTKDGAVPIKLLVTVYNIQGIQTVPTSFSGLTTIQSEYQTKFYRRFAKDMKQLGKDSKYGSMVRVVSKDGVNLQVDRSLLAVRCPELYKLIGQGSLEIRSEAVGVILHFLNTGCLSDNWTKVGVLPEIILAAHYYKLEDLKDFLNNVLGQVCTNKNAANLLILTKKLGMKRARKGLLDFIRNNFEEEKLEMIMAAEETLEGWGKQQEQKAGILNKIKRIAGF